MKGKGSERGGGRGGPREMRREARATTDRCRAGEIQIFARMSDGSAAAPFNNNLYYFNYLRPRRSPPPLLGQSRLERTRVAGRAGAGFWSCVGSCVSSDRWSVTAVVSRGVITFPCFPIESRMNFLSCARADRSSIPRYTNARWN